MDDNIWRARSKSHPTFEAESHASPKSNLLGTHHWKITGDNRNCLKKEKIYLTMTTCSSSEFTCGDGFCVDMNLKCNGKMDCWDGSDEVKCDILETNIGYKKLIIPIGRNETVFKVNITIIIRDITMINEVDSVFRTRFDYIKNWKDHNLNFKNLQRNGLNEMNEEEKKVIWTPYTVFYNIESRCKINVSDKKEVMRVISNKNFDYDLADLSNNENTFIFQGSENVIEKDRQLVVDWICDFNMYWYPFGTQRCPMIIYSVDDVVELDPENIEYRGNYQNKTKSFNKKYFF